MRRSDLEIALARWIELALPDLSAVVFERQVSSDVSGRPATPYASVRVASDTAIQGTATTRALDEAGDAEGEFVYEVRELRRAVLRVDIYGDGAGDLAASLSSARYLREAVAHARAEGLSVSAPLSTVDGTTLQDRTWQRRAQSDIPFTYVRVDRQSDFVIESVVLNETLLGAFSSAFSTAFDGGVVPTPEPDRAFGAAFGAAFG